MVAVVLSLGKIALLIAFYNPINCALLTSYFLYRERALCQTTLNPTLFCPSAAVLLPKQTRSHFFLGSGYRHDSLSSMPLMQFTTRVI